MRLAFGLTGLGISVWAITVPFTKIRFGLDDGTLGLMLLAGGSGGIAAMPFGGAAIRAFGSRAVLVTCGLSVAVLLPLLTVTPSPASFTALLLVYGALFGVLDIALNAQGAVIEDRSGRLLMSGFHACYSLGSLAVAVLCSLLLRAGLSYALCALLVGTSVLLCLTDARFLLGRTAENPAPRSGARFALPSQTTLLLGLCCFTVFQCEGATTDWSTIFLRFQRGMELANAALGYAAFAVAMAATRLAGDRVATRFGKKAVMRASCLTAIAGFAAVIFVPAGPAGVIGFGLIGLGIGNVAPLVLSAAARVNSVPTVMACGYAGFLTGPPMIGLVADRLGLGAALGIDAVLLAGVFFLAGGVVARA
jgi:predicted MFS family arabinose efflux permease